MTEEEYDALEAMPLYFDRAGGLPDRLPNGKPTPRHKVLATLQGKGLIVLLHDRWALAEPWKHKGPQKGP